jgi:hypothetical protein
MSSLPDAAPAAATAAISGKRRQFTVVGIHLAGNQTNRSAVVRSSFATQNIWSGRTRQSPDILLQFLAKKFPGIACYQGTATLSDKPENHPSPLIIDNFVASLGPTPVMDADQRLCQTLTDLGKADFYVIDVPFELPPCVLCELPCPGARRCEVDEVMRMTNFWMTLRKQGRKLRAPLPYLDRYSDFFARQIFEHQAPQLFAEFESPMGSNRAPLLARSRHVKRWIQNQFKVEPHQVIETHSSASALSWLAQSYSDANSRSQTKAQPDSPSLWPAAQIRREKSGRAMRKSTFEYLAASGRVALGANLQPAYARDLIQPGPFLAAMSALTVRSLASGEIFFQDEFMESPLLLARQPLLPAALGFFIAGAGNNAKDQ